MVLARPPRMYKGNYTHTHKGTDLDLKWTVCVHSVHFCQSGHTARTASTPENEVWTLCVHPVHSVVVDGSVCLCPLRPGSKWTMRTHYVHFVEVDTVRAERPFLHIQSGRSPCTRSTFAEWTLRTHNVHSGPSTQLTFHTHAVHSCRVDRLHGQCPLTHRSEWTGCTHSVHFHKVDRLHTQCPLSQLKVTLLCAQCPQANTPA